MEEELCEVQMLVENKRLQTSITAAALTAWAGCKQRGKNLPEVTGS